ncbi:MAG: RNA polymerase sigma factor [Planctomycetota bacterium]|jgi:RNA polymerase sigma-70 factor (ECF subfamily)
MQDAWEQIAIQSAKAGDTRAWAMLYETHVAAVFQYGLRLTFGRQDMAEELTQETFVHAARALHRYRSQSGTLRMWLFGVAKKRMQKLLTCETRRAGREQRYAAEKQIPADNNDATAVHETLARLPAKHRTVLEYKYIHGLSLKEMAEKLQLSIEAIESRLRRARQHFAEAHGRRKNEV